ncbi:MAG: YgiT-type zinc finger protein [candidate division NC10 bacterium]|nr:YgiT-type zinc finger protein [candidate division NC10 bacterium]
MECIHCKGELERSKAPFTVSRKGYHVVWDAIPAWICRQCGEPLLESREVELIQKALEVLERETAALCLRRKER